MYNKIKSKNLERCKLYIIIVFSSFNSIKQLLKEYLYNEISIMKNNIRLKIISNFNRMNFEIIKYDEPVNEKLKNILDKYN